MLLLAILVSLLSLAVISCEYFVYPSAAKIKNGKITVSYENGKGLPAAILLIDDVNGNWPDLTASKELGVSWSDDILTGKLKYSFKIATVAASFCPAWQQSGVHNIGSTGWIVRQNRIPFTSGLLRVDTELDKSLVSSLDRYKNLRVLAVVEHGSSRSSGRSGMLYVLPLTR